MVETPTAKILPLRRRGVSPVRRRAEPRRQLGRAALIARVLERELRERAGHFQACIDYDQSSVPVPRPHRFAIEAQDLDTMALAHAIDAALEG